MLCMPRCSELDSDGIVFVCLIARPHTLHMLWKKFQWSVPLYMKPISFQPNAPVTIAVSIDFCLKKLNVFPQHIIHKKKKKMNILIPHNKSLGMELLIKFLFNLFLRYYFMMQHQPIVERLDGANEWAHTPYQLLITAASTTTGSTMKGSRPRAVDRCPCVPRHSQVRLPLPWLFWRYRPREISCHDVIYNAWW